MQTSDIELITPDGAMPAFEARPAEGVRGAIIVVHEAFGVTEHIKDVCRRLAGDGFVAVAPALYHRQGAPVLESHDIEEAAPYVAKIGRSELMTDIDTTIEWLDKQGYETEHTGIVGFCMGGSVAAYVAATHELGAAVTFYGAGIIEGRFGLAPLNEEARAFKTPWLGLYGENDSSIPVTQVEAMRTELMKARVEAEIEIFEGVGHAFHNDTRSDTYDPDAAEDAWARTMAWFDQHIS